MSRQAIFNMTAIFLFSQILVILGCDNPISVYENPQYKFKIKYPKIWQIIENTDGIAVTFLSPKENSLDVYRENFSIVVQKMPRSSGHLPQYTQEAIHQISNTIQNMQIVRNETDILSENAAYRFEYITKEVNFYLRIIRIWTIIDDKAYDLTFSCDVDHCSDYLGIADTMFTSFQVE